MPSGQGRPWPGPDSRAGHWRPSSPPTQLLCLLACVTCHLPPRPAGLTLPWPWEGRASGAAEVVPLRLHLGEGSGAQSQARPAGDMQSVGGELGLLSRCPGHPLEGQLPEQPQARTLPASSAYFSGHWLSTWAALPLGTPGSSQLGSARAPGGVSQGHCSVPSGHRSPTSGSPVPKGGSTGLGQLCHRGQSQFAGPPGRGRKLTRALMW